MGGGYDQHFGLQGRAFEPGGHGLPLHLDSEEVEPYLVDRLRAVGWNGDPVLDLGLAPILHEATGGDRAAIDRAMTTLLDEAAAMGRTILAGDRLAAWSDGAVTSENAPPAGGLAEAQLDAIEGAFAEHDRKLARLRRELAELRDRPVATHLGEGSRLDQLEARLDQQDAALRHVLERLIAFFEREGPRQP